MPRTRSTVTTNGGQRTRRDRCPGVLRPWPAADGSLVRLRLVGGAIGSATLRGLAEVSQEYADGALHLTSRANLQVRGVRHDESFVDAIAGLGLLPSRRHDLARNIMVSPLSGVVGGRIDARPIAASLDALLRADDRLAELPGRFLFTLDDGRCDLVRRPTDLGLVALDPQTVQLRVGAAWGPVVDADDAAQALVRLARDFLTVRGDDADAPWHVEELPEPLRPAEPADPRTALTTPTSLADDRRVAGALLPVPDGVLTEGLVERATEHGGALVVTPWKSILVTELLP